MLICHNSTSKNADDVVITLAIRTPLAKGFKGGFKDTQLDFLVYSLLKKVIEKSQIDPALVEDICCGNVSLPSAEINYPDFQYTNSYIGQRKQSCIPRTSSITCCRLPQYNRRFHRKQILLLRPQSHTRYCQPNIKWLNRNRSCFGSRDDVCPR